MRRFWKSIAVVGAAVVGVVVGTQDSFISKGFAQNELAKPQAAAGEESAVSQVLDHLHRYASEADGEKYFALFADDAVFLGTDATERWTIDAFKAYALPIFKAGKGWTYHLKSGTRHITIDGGVAWFDELLENEKYGTCRGTGVLKRVGGDWKIAQYNLTFTVPNEKALDVVRVIRGEG